MYIRMIRLRLPVRKSNRNASSVKQKPESLYFSELLYMLTPPLVELEVRSDQRCWNTV